MAVRKKVLVVDDEPDLVELVAYNLKREGYEVASSADGEEALEKIRTQRFDLVVLDLMLPGIQGLELCRAVKADPRTASLPVIMLTAKSEEADRVTGLETGADDYVAKPFSPRELAARVRAVLRRAAGAPQLEKILVLGDVEINTDAYTATKGGRPLALSATEFRLLRFLAERKGKVFTRDQLLDAVWKGEAYVEPRTVDVHIRRLRAQVEDNPARPVLIKTKRGVGYYGSGEI